MKWLLNFGRSGWQKKEKKNVGFNVLTLMPPFSPIRGFLLELKGNLFSLGFFVNKVQTLEKIFYRPLKVSGFSSQLCTWSWRNYSRYWVDLLIEYFICSEILKTDNDILWGLMSRLVASNTERLKYIIVC